MAQTDNVKVQIRVRPLSPAERDSCWTIREQCMFEMSASGKRLNEFTFDHVFLPQQSTHELYNTVARSIVGDVVRGFNGTIFAYGQTGSGKTFTMQGDMLAGGSFPGLIQFALDDLFRVAHERSREQQFRIAASYLEIYNETLKDLLSPQQHVKLRTDVTKGVFVEGLTKTGVNSVQQVLSLLAAGQQNRQVAATNINEHSSRSHTIFSVNIESCFVGREDEGITSSTLSLVDLAGSERIAVSGTDGLRKKEGAHINRSLLAFNNVMQKLAERTPFIPYRDSKLTHILSQSLGGDSKTLVVCTVTPAAVHRDVTLATLKFAQRAKMIENKPQVNETLSDKQLIRKLEREVTRLQQQIHEAQKENLPMGVNGQPVLLVPLQEKAPTVPAAECVPLEARMARLHSMLESYPTIARRHTYGCSSEIPEVEEEMLVQMKNKRVSVGATPQEREQSAREEYAELMAQKDQRIQQLEAQLAMERRKKEEEAAWRLRLLQELEEEKSALENDTRRVMQYAIAQAQRRIDRSTDLLHSGVAATMEQYEAFMCR